MVYASRRGSSGRKSRYGRAYSQKRSAVTIRRSITGNVPALIRWGFDLLPPNTLDPGAKLGATVVRAHLDIELHQSSDAANAYGGIYAGLAVYAGNEFITEDQPPFDPYVDSNSISWMYWRYRSAAELAFASTSHGTPPTTRSYHFSVNTKSKRKIHVPGDTLIFVMTANGGAMAGITQMQVATQATLLLA